MKVMTFLRDVGFTGLLDIAIMSAIVYALLVWFKRSKAAFVLSGMIIIGLIYLLARQLNLLLTAAILQGFFAVILLAVIIIFQEDLKYLFEQLALWGLNKKRKVRSHHPSRVEVEIVARSLTDMANDKIGALIVLKGTDIIDRHLTGGIDLNGDLSEEVIKSLFDPHSIGHDGAVIIEGDKITQFSCHLPLSKDLKKIGRSGTRHAAALGLAELCNALCLVSSEELGTISVTRHGEIETINEIGRLTTILNEFYDETYPAQTLSPLVDIFRKNLREKISAVLLTLALWFVFVHESQITYQRFNVPISTTNLAPDLDLREIRPSEVEIIIAGKRSAFYFFNKKEIRLFLNMLDEGPGTVRKQIQESEVIIPDGMTLESISPNRVLLTILPKGK